MNMHFEGSSNVTLLFDFWDVHGPAGMVLSVFVVLLLTVFYELLRVWKINLALHSRSAAAAFPFSPTPPCLSPILGSSPSEMSLAPTDKTVTPAASTTTLNSWLLHGLETALHVVQVTLGYLLMLCVMSYNVWVFLGVIVGSGLGYFLAFPLISGQL